MTDFSENLAGVLLTWDDQNDFEDGFKVYRSAAPFGEGDLPPVLVTLPPNTTEYLDSDILAGYNYHYRVSTFSGGVEVFATAMVTANTKLVPDTIGEFFRGGYYIGNITIPVGSINEGTYAVIMAGIEGEPPTTMQVKTTISGTTGTTSTIDGKVNTDAMILAGPTLHPAAKYCDEFVSDIYDDWYLPSLNELGLASANRTLLAGVLQFQVGDMYWSSTQHSIVGWEFRQFYMRFSDGYSSYSHKTTVYRVRPVRRVKLA